MKMCFLCGIYQDSYWEKLKILRWERISKYVDALNKTLNMEGKCQTLKYADVMLGNSQTDLESLLSWNSSRHTGQFILLTA